MKRRQVNIVSLGCSKNLVDTERLLSMMAANGIRAEVTERPTFPLTFLWSTHADSSEMPKKNPSTPSCRSRSKG